MKPTLEKMTRLKLPIVFLVFVLNGCVSIEAIPYDEENKCWGTYEVVDTLLGGFDSCEGSETEAEDEDGNFWRFDSTCLPSGFKKTKNLTEEIAWAPPCDEI